MNNRETTIHNIFKVVKAVERKYFMPTSLSYPNELSKTESATEVEMRESRKRRILRKLGTKLWSIYKDCENIEIEVLIEETKRILSLELETKDMQ